MAPECEGEASSASALSQHAARTKSTQGLHAPRGGARRGAAGLCHPAGHARAPLGGARTNDACGPCPVFCSRSDSTKQSVSTIDRRSGEPGQNDPCTTVAPPLPFVSPFVPPLRSYHAIHGSPSFEGFVLPTVGHRRDGASVRDFQTGEGDAHMRTIQQLSERRGRVREWLRFVRGESAPLHDERPIDGRPRRVSCAAVMACAMISISLPLTAWTAEESPLTPIHPRTVVAAGVGYENAETSTLTVKT